MKKLLLLPFLAAMLAPATGSAQSSAGWPHSSTPAAFRNISGRVTDKATGEGLPSVTVTLKGAPPSICWH